MDYIYVGKNVDEVVTEFSKYDTFAFDIETTGLEPIDSRILLYQIAFKDKAYVIVGGVDIKPLLPFFSSGKWLKIIQNAKFDTKFLLHHHNAVTSHIFDTQIAERLLYPDAFNNTNLKSLAFKYLNISMDKEIRDSFIDMNPTTMFTDQQLKYAAQDAEVLFGIMEQQKIKLEENGLMKVAELEFELAPVVGAMENVGVPIDVKKWEGIFAGYKTQHEASRLRMHEHLFDGGENTEQLGMFTRDSINLNSWQQLRKAFHNIGVDMDKTDERTLSLINHPAAKELLEYRGFQKIMTSYGRSFIDRIHPFDGRVHASFQQMGTATGRFACKEPNFQQVPDEFRQCVSLKDHDLVIADYANIELRILAELSGDDALIKAFISGDDPHKSTASLMFNIPIDNVTKDQRFIAKTINFGICYGMGPTKLMDMLNKGKPKNELLSMRKVAGIMARYKDTYRKASDWLVEAGNLAYRRSYSETMMGRKRWYERPDSQLGDWDAQVASIKRKGANSPIQGTNADITKLAMLNLYHDLRTYKYKGDIILQVHDEIGVLAHKSQSESIKMLVVESMENSAKELLKVVPVKVDAYVSDVWKKG